MAEGYHKSNGRIDRLEVDNFKSYRGHQYIGPFKSFTAVIGPNGSGKSNLMDAISFVLGVKTAQLRGSLKELLYTNSEDSSAADRPVRGLVKLVYVMESGEEVHFSRHIQPSSASAAAADAGITYSSVYKVNDRTVTWEAYSQRLSSFGILVKVRNFLVFQVRTGGPEAVCARVRGLTRRCRCLAFAQGDIEAVAQKSPQGLTLLFEQISGSDGYKRQYEELEKGKAEAEEKARGRVWSGPGCSHCTGAHITHAGNLVQVFLATASNTLHCVGQGQHSRMRAHRCSGCDTHLLCSKPVYTAGSPPPTHI